MRRVHMLIKMIILKKVLPKCKSFKTPFGPRACGICTDPNTAETIRQD